MDNRCDLDRTCPAAGITKQSSAEYDACTMEQMAKEDVDGCKKFKSPIASHGRLLTRCVMYRARCSPAR